MYHKLLVGAGLALMALSVGAMDSSGTVESGAAAPSIEVRVTTDLAADARLARERKVPLLVMFAQEGCAYCELVESEFLRPMLISGDYDDRVVIRIVMLDSFDSIRDFDGNMVESDDLAMRYRAPLTPTVVFLSPAGREIAPRLVGVGTVDFYGGDLDARIDTALLALRQPRVAVDDTLPLR